MLFVSYATTGPLMLLVTVSKYDRIMAASLLVLLLPLSGSRGGGTRRHIAR
jgi:hypothetical protein